MTYIIMDLEWNGAFNEKTGSYFNEIIEIGAVKVNTDLHKLDEFHVMLKPVVSTKLSQVVLGLTSITDEDLQDGITFPSAVEQLIDWTNNEHAVLLTWSNTDLMVLMENLRYYYADDTIPFIHGYVDVQRYAQKQIGVDLSQQLGLGKACEMLGVGQTDTDWHRALDDSRQTMMVLREVYEKDTFLKEIRVTNEEFYQRVHFKPYFISDSNHPELKKGAFHFQCELCGRTLRNQGAWEYHHRSFCAEMLCRQCKIRFLARVQCKRTFDGYDIKRRLTVKPTAAEKNTEHAQSKGEPV